jgi:pantoate--beta-alanine ligase
MIIIHGIAEARKIIREKKKSGMSIGLVPTMGALHKGHLSLMQKARKENDFTVVWIFVNPIQFGPNEDFSRYPRMLSEDSALCESAGVDMIFAPEAAEIIGGNLLAFVDIEKLQDNLCGIKRPGHFRGVCTIVAKFFNVLTPDRAYFGKKDIQQYFIIKKMTKDLNFDIEIIPCEIVREKDGLALSSRNMYLSVEERSDALALNRSIKKGIAMFESGITDPGVIIAELEKNISAIKSAKIDYISIVDENMKDADIVRTGDILALAVFIGKTRLIDNHIIGEKICF